MEYIDFADAEKLVVRQEDQNDITFEFWDFEGKGGEMTVPAKVAIVFAPFSVLLYCFEESLSKPLKCPLI